MSPVDIRPIRDDDKQALRSGFARLSERSRYRRFLSPHDELSPAEIRYLTEVDHHDHEALVAVDASTGEGLGIARYIRSSTDPHNAELAVAVVDDRQNQGIGRRLTGALAQRAREEGIRRFTALVLAENTSMLKLLDELGTARRVRVEQGTMELIVDLPEEGLGAVGRLLRAAARGEIRPLGRRPSGDRDVGEA